MHAHFFEAIDSSIRIQVEGIASIDHQIVFFQNRNQSIQLGIDCSSRRNHHQNATRGSQGTHKLLQVLKSSHLGEFWIFEEHLLSDTLLHTRHKAVVKGNGNPIFC